MIVTKVSDITAASLAEYLRLVDPTNDDYNTLASLQGVAETYITQYTGKTLEQLDDYQDIVIAVMVLVQDMWDNRTMYVDKGNMNKVVQTILDMHTRCNL